MLHSLKLWVYFTTLVQEIEYMYMYFQCYEIMPFIFKDKTLFVDFQ